jgi:serine/threonine protein phosphatase PrpC
MIPKRTAAPELRVGALSHTGKVREENQDRMSRFYCPLGEVFVVADGMGGHMGGATAAAMVTQGFEEALAGAPGGASTPDILEAAGARINAAIHREAICGNPETAKMGSTVVLALLAGTTVTLAHAGDSRAYLFRKGRLECLTRDHSRVQHLVDQGHLTETEAREHPDASVLNRCLGARPDVRLEISRPFRLKPGDALMLCSDGLCGYLEREAIGATLARTPDPQDAADTLVKLALDAGGEDNTTVQVIQLGARKATRYDPNPPAPRRDWQVQMLWVAGALLLLGLVLVAGILLVRRLYRPARAPGPPNAPKVNGDPSPRAKEPLSKADQGKRERSAFNTAPLASPTKAPSTTTHAPSIDRMPGGTVAPGAVDKSGHAPETPPSPAPISPPQPAEAGTHIPEGTGGHVSGTSLGSTPSSHGPAESPDSKSKTGSSH